jgi:hypothetical protein
VGTPRNQATAAAGYRFERQQRADLKIAAGSKDGLGNLAPVVEVLEAGYHFGPPFIAMGDDVMEVLILRGGSV